MKTVYVLQHVSHETLGSLEVFFGRAGVAWRNVQPHESPWTWDEVAGLVVLGGPMNVEQVFEYPFLRHELTWIHEAIMRDLPVLGICLGAQLLAKSLGSRVFPHKVKEIGWYDVEFAAPADDLLFGGLTGRHTVFQWHGDTFELPVDAIQLARGEQCEQQAFRYGTKAYGLQFHVEVTAEMVDAWLQEPDNRRELLDLEYIDAAAIRSRLPAAIRELEIVGQHLLSRFAGLCRQS